MIRMDETEHAADCCAFLAQQAEPISPQLAAALDEAMWLLGSAAAIEDTSLHELSAALEDAEMEQPNPEAEDDAIAALLDLRARIDAALLRYPAALQAWQTSRINALCHLATAVLDRSGDVYAP